MNHTKIIKYIKSQFRNALNDKIKYYEQYICNSLNKLIRDQYSLKNPALREYCIIDSRNRLNRQLSGENNECIKDLEELFLYRLSVDNDYFNKNIHLYDNLNILPIRMKKINYEFDDENKDNSHITNKINIIDIRMIDCYGYILYETNNQL